MNVLVWAFWLLVVIALIMAALAAQADHIATKHGEDLDDKLGRK